MVVQGSKSGDWGVRKVSDGWHIVELGEGIDSLKREDGSLVEDKNGNYCYKFPAKINDETDDDNGLDLSILIFANKFGERKVGDILACCGEMENFEAAFPGDRSFFEDEIFNKIKIKAPGKFVRLKKETSMGKDKEGNAKEYSNIVKILDISLTPEDEDVSKEKSTPKKDSKPAKKDW